MHDLAVERPIVLDILDTPGTPALSSTSDMPIVETKPDATPAPAQVEAEAAAEEARTDSESATEPEVEPSASDEPKRAKGVQKRLDELVRQREETAQQLKDANSRLDRALAALERFGGGPAATEEAMVSAQAEDAEPVRPSKAAYADPDQYEQAFIAYAEQRAAWAARKEVRAAQEQAFQAAQQATIEQAQREAQSAYGARLEQAKAKHADWAEIAESPTVHVSMAMATAIIHSENGPELQYHLGKNPEEAKRIAKLPPPMQLLEMGRLEAKLTAAPAAPQLAPTPAVSKAPPPIKPLAAGAAPVSKSISEMSMEEYAAYRRQQQRESRAR